MKRLLLILILTLSFQTFAKADDISDFEIEGISLGDNLLDHFNIEELKQQLKKTNTTYTSKKIKRTWFLIEDYKTYKQIGIHYKVDGSYEIVNISGTIIYKDINQCNPQLKKIVNDIEKQLPSAKKIDNGKGKDNKFPKTFITNIVFKLKIGQIYLSCIDWDKNTEKKYGWNDHLSVELDTPEFLKWFNNEAYK